MFAETEMKFLKLCKEYYENNSFLYMSSESEKYKTVVQMDLNIIKLEFCYYKKGNSFLNAPSTLLCRIYLSKSSPIYFHLTDILSELKAKDFRCVYFSFIENPHKMELCFKQLISIIEKYLPDIEVLALNKCSEMQENKLAFMRKAYKLTEKDLNITGIMSIKRDMESDFIALQDWHEVLTLHRFTLDSAYHRFLLGNFKKAKKLYAKMGKKEPLLPYEEDLVAFIDTEECKSFKPIPDECFSQKIGLREQNPTHVTLLIYTLVAYVPCAVVFCLLFAITNFFLSLNTVISLQVPVLLGLVPAAIPAIFGGMAFRNTISKIVYRKDSKLKIEIDKITISKVSDIFIKIVFVAFTALSMYMSLMLLTCNVNFYEDKIVCNKGEYWMDYQEYQYSDIKDLYFVEYFIGDDGSKIENNSYVIGFEDGYTIDFDDWDCTELVGFLESKGCEVTYVESNEVLVEMGYDY